MKELICIKCKLKIDKKKDNWINLRSFNKSKQVEEANAHLKCWREQYKDKVQQAFDDKIKTISPMLSKMMGRIK